MLGHRGLFPKQRVLVTRRCCLEQRSDRFIFNLQPWMEEWKFSDFFFIFIFFFLQWEKNCGVFKVQKQCFHSNFMCELVLFQLFVVSLNHVLG